jgi:hypothetical protein
VDSPSLHHTRGHFQQATKTPRHDKPQNRNSEQVTRHHWRTDSGDLLLLFAGCHSTSLLFFARFFAASGFGADAAAAADWARNGREAM